MRKEETRESRGEGGKGKERKGKAKGKGNKGRKESHCIRESRRK